MIRRRCLHKYGQAFCEEKGSALILRRENPVSLTSPQITFSDTAIVASTHPRFIGNGDTGIITQGLEEAFLSVARVIDSPTVVDHITVTVKRPSISFDTIVFDLVRVPCPNGEVHLTGDSILTSIVVPGATISNSETAFCRSQSFPVTVLDDGDLIAVRVEPTGIAQPSFYAAATIS